MIRVDSVTSFPVGGISAHVKEVVEVQLEVLHTSESKSELVGVESPCPRSHPNANPEMVTLTGIGFRAPLDGAESVMTGAAIRRSFAQICTASSPIHDGAGRIVPSKVKRLTAEPTSLETVRVVYTR